MNIEITEEDRGLSADRSSPIETVRPADRAARQ
jgi:hypothetical protein